jgi:hypothetical protein
MTATGWACQFRAPNERPESTRPSHSHSTVKLTAVDPLPSFDAAPRIEVSGHSIERRGCSARNPGQLANCSFGRSNLAGLVHARS